MFRIIDGRATGKTNRLLLLAKEYNGIIICSNPEMLKDRAERLGLTDIEFISYRDSLRSGKIDDKKPIFIDELEMYIKYCFAQANICGYTLSEE